ncbi:MAG: hypothetical protein E6K19_03900 [Methanobacteriota archaeon]|nr:MAG: hypothetical protein E6K19_03900 [Euryarchaeota archaeon]
MGALWTYYWIVLRGSGGGLLFRLTGETASGISGLEVDENGKDVRSGDGDLRFHAFERAEIDEMRPLVLLSGRLVPADIIPGKDPRLELV